MIKLSDRLNLMANQIEQNETMADIGTDHGFLPIYLREKNICPKVILADISEGSLKKAKTNVAAHHIDGFEFRCGNGIQVLKNREVDVIAIAGMGGILMTEILLNDIEKTKSFKRFILQPRNGQSKLRAWLLENEFLIERELLVREGRFICEIIVAVPKEETSIKRDDRNILKSDDDIQFEIPLQLLSENGELAVEFLKRKLNIEKKILHNIKKSNLILCEKDDKLKNVENRIKYMETMVNEFDFS